MEGKEEPCTKVLESIAHCTVSLLSPDKSCRIKYRTNYKILPKSWDFEKERLKPSASGALEFNVELNNLANCCTREAMRKKKQTSFFPKRIINRLYRTVLTGTMPSIVKYPFPT